jgi:aromatic amino acid aminotransferase I
MPSWYKVLRTLCNDNEGVLTTEWTFATAIVTMKPCGITAVPVAADSQGMRSDDLRKVLSEWDDTQRGGMARPHVLYIVPVGDNPCGHTMGAARKADIYNICVEYGVYILPFELVDDHI